jgi:hypothetical protein
MPAIALMSQCDFDGVIQAGRLLKVIARALPPLPSSAVVVSASLARPRRATGWARGRAARIMLDRSIAECVGEGPDNAQPFPKMAVSPWHSAFVGKQPANSRALPRARARVRAWLRAEGRVILKIVV